MIEAALRNDEQRLLLISNDVLWREALEISLDVMKLHTGSVSAGHWAARAPGFEPTAVVVDADSCCAEPTDDPLEPLIQLGTALRASLPDVVLIFMTAVPRAGLNERGADWGATAVLLQEIMAPKAQAAQLLEAIERCKPRVARTVVDGSTGQSLPTPAAMLATIEITVGKATMQCDVCIGDDVISTGPKDWSRRSDLTLVDEEFSRYESLTSLFGRLDSELIRLAGQRILLALREYLDDAHEICRRRLHSQGAILHRFILADGDLEFVPFEVVSTANAGEFLRYVHPIARKLVTRQQHRSPDRLPDRGRPRRRVLFIVSDVDGVLRVQGRKFKGENFVTLGPLQHLQTELQQVRDLYEEKDFVEITLQPDQDGIECIRKALQAQAFDIVHFSGHSLRADTTGEVYLALPAPAGKPLVPFNVEGFAGMAADGDAQLVILSSCEGSSGLALSRLASRGVPAVAGFRWPVVDRDASFFTVAFHRELRKDGRPVPLTQAFHRALVSLRDHTEGQITSFSPVLVIQKSPWHDFCLET